jgi:hypothetical protein
LGRRCRHHAEIYTAAEITRLSFQQEALRRTRDGR